VEEALEPLERLRVGEDDLRDRGAVDAAVVVEDGLAEALDELRPHGLVLGKQPVDDLVAGDDGGAVPRERREGFALAGSDAARDGDGDRSGQATP
jgi:hypothetical protein